MLHAGEIKVAVAANVSYAINDLVKTFNSTHPHTKIHVILGSSGKLTAQIKHGAPFDIFMSADMKYPQSLYEDSLSVSKPKIYARGTLALFSSIKRHYERKLFVLTDANIKKIAIANPKTAPYGIAAKEVLIHAKLYEKLKEKFVYGESISQTVLYAKSATDIGIIATSALYAPQMKAYKEHIHWIEVDTSFYTPIKQGIVILKEAKENIEVKAFYDFMLGAQAKAILEQYGYKVE